MKIFFGVAPGAGTTCAMLRAGLDVARQGTNVVVSVAAVHGCPEGERLLEALAALPHVRVLRSDDAQLDLAAALLHRPQLLLVEDLAHENLPGSLHGRRYQEVQELLLAGTDVYTTVDVRQIESLSDAVCEILGASARAGIPDELFDGADCVELVDADPRRAPERWEARFGPAAQEKIDALRMLAARRFAERLSRRLSRADRQKQGGSSVGEHILVCLSSAPSNQKIIHTAARMAAAFGGTLTALFVRTPGYETMTPEDRKRLQDSARLAEQLGARIETAYGEDIAYQISEFARLSGVTKIVLGRSGVTRRHPWSKPALTERLAAMAPGLDIYIIPDGTQQAGYRQDAVVATSKHHLALRDLGKAAGILLLTTLVSLIFQTLGFPETAIVAIYILGVLLVSLATNGWVASSISAVAGVLVFNFFFTRPRFTFMAYGKDYPLTFAAMFIVALITGTLAQRLKEHVKQTGQVAFRTKILFDTNRLLQRAVTANDAVESTATQLGKLLGLNIVMYLLEDGNLSEPRVFPATRRREGGAPSCNPDLLTGGVERAAAMLAARNKRRAGATTDTLPDAVCLYLPARLGERVYGVAGVDVTGGTPDTFESSILQSILGECALALENIRNVREREQTALLAQGEQLRANLLRSISHDLRTPLTAISGNASNLLSNGDKLDDAARTAIYADIHDDALWLINLVENLLFVTRIEDGRMKIRLTTELVDEVVCEALRHIDPRRSEYTVTVEHEDELLLARMDARLVMQVIINIVDNAIQHTPPGTSIRIRTGRAGRMARIEIADDGPGVPDEMKPRIFDMFYSGSSPVADGRRSLGLGLALCKSIVCAHGGNISVLDNRPHGAIFSFTLPYGGKTHEQAADSGR